MSEVVHNASKEFWRPPAAPATTATAGMVEVCDGCGTEFMSGARFCYICGTARDAQTDRATKPVWMESLAFLKALEFHRVKEALGLPTASLLAFVAGAGCLLAVLTVSMVYTVQNLADFQAIQSYRLQWLMAAVAAFVAGILLKKPPSTKD